MKRFFIPIILLILTLNISACGGIGGGLLSAALGGNSVGAGSYGDDVGDYDYEGDEDLDSEDDESDAEDYMVDTDDDFAATADEIAVDETGDTLSEEEIVADAEVVSETDDALSTEGNVSQDSGVGNAATDESEAAPSTDDLIESSTGPVALPVTPPREGEECSIDLSNDSEGATMAMSYIPDESEQNTFSRTMKPRWVGNKFKITSPVKNALRNSKYEGEALTCQYNEEEGKYIWQQFSPSMSRLGVAVLYGEDDEDEKASIYLGDLKVTSSGKFKFSGKKLPKTASRVEFKLYDKLTSIILE